jgi:hypothetical protein
MGEVFVFPGPRERALILLRNRRRNRHGPGKDPFKAGGVALWVEEWELRRAETHGMNLTQYTRLLELEELLEILVPSIHNMAQDQFLDVQFRVMSHDSLLHRLSAWTAADVNDNLSYHYALALACRTRFVAA